MKIAAATAKFTDVRLAGLGYCGYLVRESEVFVKNET